MIAASNLMAKMLTLFWCVCLGVTIVQVIFYDFNIFLVTMIFYNIDEVIQLLGSKGLDRNSDISKALIKTNSNLPYGL